VIESAAKVIDLLNYIEQIEKLKRKPTFSLPDEYFVSHQHELKNLPELKFNLQQDGDDIWLKLPRLQEVAPPELDEILKPWVSVSKSPDKLPEIKQEITVFQSGEETRRESLRDNENVKILFDWYVEYLWKPWSITESPRRKSIYFYNKLFALQQAIASEGAETPLELVWGVGYAVWKKEDYATPVKHPLLLQACNVSLNEATLDLEIRPRDVEAKLELDCYAEMEISGISQLETFWKNVQTAETNRLNPFESSTFESILKAAVGHLDPSGSYINLKELISLPAPSTKMLVTDGWVIFGRKRTGDILLEDVRRLKRTLEASSSLPGVIQSFVTAGDDTVRRRAEIPFRGLSTSNNPSGARELFFPMPYNDEQVSIIQKLESNDGVVVQGPPGTGKTHTIANVICHYLAQGKRVLVTAKGESALAVVQEKLPERIESLCVSLLSDERDGKKQFEHSIQTIAARVSQLNPSQSEKAIFNSEQLIDQLHAKISNVDKTLEEHAQLQMRTYDFRGKLISPEEIARKILEEADMHQWFDDDPPESSKILVDNDEINALRQSRKLVGGLISYVGSTIPRVDEFPEWVDLLALHRDLVRAKSIEAAVEKGVIFPLADATADTFAKAKELLEFLESRQETVDRLSSSGLDWISKFRSKLANKSTNDQLVATLRLTCEALQELESKRTALVSQAVHLQAGAELNEEFTDALKRLVAGKSAFMLPIGNAVARELVNSVTVAGVKPKSSDEWKYVSDLVDWRLQARKALARWTSLSVEFDLEVTDEMPEQAIRSLMLSISLIKDIDRLQFEFDACLDARVTDVFGKNVSGSLKNESERGILNVRDSLHSHLDKGRLGYAIRRVAEISKKLDVHSGVITTELRAFLAYGLGQPSLKEDDLRADWLSKMAVLGKLQGLWPHISTIKDTAEKIEQSGAPKWANRIRIQAVESEIDSIVPFTWREAWEWRLALNFLDRLDSHHKVRDLIEERRQLTQNLAKTYQDLVAEKTWLGVFNNSPDSVRQALQAYLSAVQSMGAGTGVRAVRHRKNARDAMVRAYKAVPCWVLPQWRVSETIPAEVGLFDLVIVDEASQSDIWALPALLRGKKLLVVGDHKQVSPSAVGAAEERVKELVNRFLGEQPHGAQMTPDKSIYDLASVVFAGNSVMLKEHFRSVPAIIEFSNREFYEGDIRPLRLPKANERLDPPLIDVFVKGGNRKNDINKAEAKAIVNEIASLIADPQFEGRSIGVVTLLGTEQASYIHKLISDEISPSEIVNRKISVGPPPVFQGRERDIMMVSMVIGPGERGAANRADMNQRFNVALSRARDRMYLFRSITESDAKDESLTGRVIQHFKQPFRHDIKKVENLRDRCQSGFELEVFDELIKRGYRVTPQVPSGGYFIDFVVEGNEGRRLAIECDGDRFHGPGQWSDDMARQRVLERAGWTFWRCFASSFVRRRNEVVADLIQTLEKLGIEPLGSETVDSTVWVAYREVDPFEVELAEIQSEETN
jgi:very-short-patch-repair endonuclease